MELCITTRPRAFRIYGDVKDDTNQCLQRGEREMDYEVIVYGDTDNLTPEGFLLDRNAIPDYFRVTYSGVVAILPSCEVMASQAAKAVAALCEGRAHRVQANVGGATAIWTKSDGAPGKPNPTVLKHVRRAQDLARKGEVPYA